MTDKISFSLLIVILINIILALALVDTNQNLNEGDNCFVNSTQQEGICTQITKCEKPCAAKEIKFERCKRTSRRSMPIVCCPKDRPTNSISAESRAEGKSANHTIQNKNQRTKCLEYKEFACYLTYYGGSVDQTPIGLKVSNCTSDVIAVIMGGEEARIREFPHMALLAYGDDSYFGCGGTLISDQFVLSAAHCLHHNTYGAVRYVRLGEHDHSITNDSVHIDVQIEEVIPHPDYSAQYSYNDIGLIKLKQKVNFTIAIRPACLPEEPTTVSNATATGWGLVDEDNKSSVLMKVNVNLIDDDVCQKPGRQFQQGLNVTTQFCAGSNTHTNNTCEGDSGGPLQVIHEHHFCTFSIIGVTSFGNGCNSQRNRSRGVYTRVFPYLGWIESHVWGDQ